MTHNITCPHLEDLPERKNLQEKWTLFLEEQLKRLLIRGEKDDS